MLIAIMRERMKLINLNAISLSTGKELLSIPLDYVEDDLETEHRLFYLCSGEKT